MHEIITLLEDEKEATAPSTSVILIPDPEEPYTDEDSEDEEDTGGRGMDVNHLGRGLLNQVAEIIVNNVPDDLPDVTDYDDLGEIVATEDERRRSWRMPTWRPPQWGPCGGRKFGGRGRRRGRRRERRRRKRRRFHC